MNERNHKINKRILVAITGASGSLYAERLIDVLVSKVPIVYVVATDAGKKVAKFELTASKSDFSLVKLFEGGFEQPSKSVIRVFNNDDLFAPVASGSSAPTDMVLVPCSMGTLSRIAQGNSANLIERAADVVIKQKRNLIIVPRETPLSTIHLKNMLILAEMGVHIVPAMPAFYQRPKTIDDIADFLVGRILELIGITHELYRPWNSRLT